MYGREPQYGSTNEALFAEIMRSWRDFHEVARTAPAGKLILVADESHYPEIEVPQLMARKLATGLGVAHDDVMPHMATNHETGEVITDLGTAQGDQFAMVLYEQYEAGSTPSSWQLYMIPDENQSEIRIAQ